MAFPSLLRWLAAVALLVALAGPVLGAVDETPYRPSSTVKLYHKYTFDITLPYFQTVAINTALPVAIVGFLCFLIIAFWTCCRCCGNCRPKSENVSNRFKLFVVLMIVCITLACVGMLIYGFKADSTQSKAMNSIPGLVDNVIIWKNESVVALQNLINVTNITILDAQSIVDNSGICTALGSGCSQAQNIITSGNVIISQANIIISSIGNVELQKIKDDLASNITVVDDYRHLGMVILLSVLFGTLVLQAIIALTDSRCPSTYQVREYCIGKLFTCLLTFIIILLIVLIWMLSALLLFTSVIFADFCIAPANNIIRAAKITEPITVYYLTCDQNSSAVSPLAGNLGLIDSSRNLTRQYMTALNASAQSCVGVSCPAAQQAVNTLGVDTEALYVAVGVPDETGNANTGVLRQFSCTKLNGKIQAVFHVVCDDFFLSAAETFQVLIAFSGLFVLLQIFVGLSANRVEDDDTSVRPTIYGYDNNKGDDVEMKPPAYTGHVLYANQAAQPV